MAKKVLIVDDSTSIRQMVNFTLTERGYDVIEAKNGKMACELLAGIQPQVVITDIHMPEMDGIELTRWIRADAKHKFVPVIILTTESEQAMRDEGKKAGATAWIVKPFSPENLLEVMIRSVGEP